MSNRRRNRVTDNADVVEFRGVVFQIDVKLYTPPIVLPKPGLHIIVKEPISGEEVFHNRIRYADVDAEAINRELDRVAAVYTTLHSSVVKACELYLPQTLAWVERNREELVGIPDDWDTNAEWRAAQEERRTAENA